MSLKLLPLLSLLLLLLPLLSTAATTVTGAHQELLKYGFPVGLLPTSIKTYAINQTTGNFFVDLGEKCRITLPPDNYLASYSKKITGKIVNNKIEEVNGISVKAFFQWWGITGIRSSGENLVFEVGMVTAKYPANKFGEIPECEGKRSSS